MHTDIGLGRYKLSDEDTRFLDSLGFRPIAMGVDLELLDLKSAAFASLNNQNSVYFWRMRHGGEEYKIYVGRTKSLPRRLREYRNKFQPGVPNDFKLRHFQSWAYDKFPGSLLDLYATLRDDNQAVVKEVWRKTKPFINERTTVQSHNLKRAHGSVE